MIERCKKFYNDHKDEIIGASIGAAVGSAFVVGLVMGNKTGLARGIEGGIICCAKTLTNPDTGEKVLIVTSRNGAWAAFTDHPPILSL